MFELLKKDISIVKKKLIFYLLIMFLPFDSRFAKLIMFLINFEFIKIISSENEKNNADVWYLTLPIKREHIIISKFLTVTFINILSIIPITLVNRQQYESYVFYLAIIILIQYLYTIFISIFGIVNSEIYVYALILIVNVLLNYNNLYLYNLMNLKLIILFIAIYLAIIYLATIYYSKKDI